MSTGRHRPLDDHFGRGADALLRYLAHFTPSEFKAYQRSAPVSDEPILNRLSRALYAESEDEYPRAVRLYRERFPVSVRKHEGEPMLTVYRGVSKKDPSGRVHAGDWCALNAEYARQHGGGRTVSARVPAEDVCWAGTDGNEWLYAPRALRIGEDAGGTLGAIRLLVAGG